MPIPPTLPDMDASNCNAACGEPVFDYAVMSLLDEYSRLVFMRNEYRFAAHCFGFRAGGGCPYGNNPDNLTIIKEKASAMLQSWKVTDAAILDLLDAKPTTDMELMTTYLGEYRDQVSGNTRRTRPWGTLISEMDGYTDPCPIECTPKTGFENNVSDDVPDPDFTGIKYVPSWTTPPPDFEPLSRKFIDFKEDSNKDGYSEKHKSCLRRPRMYIR